MSARAHTLSVPAPAKINLFLHVLGRREDGYHELQTVFQFLDRCDTVTLSARDDGEIRRLGGLAGVPEEADLAIRAARLLREAAGRAAGADIELAKRIPAGAGLGGGSSDAASTLVGLDRLWGLGLGEDALAALGMRLGADVPVFVRGRAAWAEGVGERLTPIEPDEGWCVVLVPGPAVSTASIFADSRLTRETEPLTMIDFLRDGEEGRGRRLDTAALLARSRNDCEPVARALHSGIDEALRWLSAYAPARLTGTGSAVCARIDTEARAREVLAAAPARWEAFVARTLNRSPLLGKQERAREGTRNSHEL